MDKGIDESRHVPPPEAAQYTRSGHNLGVNRLRWEHDYVTQPKPVRSRHDYSGIQSRYHGSATGYYAPKRRSFMAALFAKMFKLFWSLLFFVVLGAVINVVALQVFPGITDTVLGVVALAWCLFGLVTSFVVLVKG